MARVKSASFQGGCYLYVDYTYTQNVSANTSTVSYKFGVHFGDYYFNATDKRVSFSSSNPGTASHSWSEDGPRAWPHGGTHQDYVYKSGSFVVTHANDGRAALAISASFKPSAAGGGGTRSLSTTVMLAQIPRLSSPPSAVTLTNITSTSVHATFTDGSGGAPIDSRQIGYGTNSASPQIIVASDRSTDITGLTPGTTYYFWARTHNVAGYTAWGPRSSATTLRVPSAPAAPTISNIRQTTASVSFTPPNNGGSTITAYQVGYGTSSAGPATIISATSPQTVTDLLPGTVHYFWVRAQNSVGWGPWSSPTTAQTIAGVRVKVGTEYKLAVPYVNDNGVWKLAHPWARIAGVWKETN
jgi:hypothetical protein